MSDAYDNRNKEASPTTSLERGGITKREWVATHVLQALITGWSVDIALRRTDSTFAPQAVRIADALLTELEKDHEP